MKKSTAQRPSAHIRRLTAPRAELAFRAAELRHDLDELLRKHNAKMQIGWDGKWAKFQFVFPDLSTTEALTVMECRKDGRARYMTEAEEEAQCPSAQ